MELLQARVAPRQEHPPPPDTWTTELVGDGDPHQDKFHKQVTDSITCASATCGISDTQTVSITVGFTIANGGGGKVTSPAQWISGGFSVSKSRSESETANCNGNPGDTVCLWHRTDHTAYTVKDVLDHDRKDSARKPYILRSPNKGDYNSGFYCVINNCRNKNDNYWESGEAGGPSNTD